MHKLDMEVLNYLLMQTTNNSKRIAWINPYDIEPKPKPDSFHEYCIVHFKEIIKSYHDASIVASATNNGIIYWTNSPYIIDWVNNSRTTDFEKHTLANMIFQMLKYATANNKKTIKILLRPNLFILSARLDIKESI